MKKRVLFVTSVYSPFWIEFCRAFNPSSSVQFHIAFTEPRLQDRGLHWKEFRATPEEYSIFDGSNLNRWLTAIFERYKPDIVLASGVKGLATQVSYRLTKLNNARFGVIAEQPQRHTFFMREINQIIYRWILARRKPDFFLAIGERACDIYRPLVPLDCPVIRFQYYQDLTPLFESPDHKLGRPLQFLFSGRLVPRNSIREMVQAFERLARHHPDGFRWCVSAKGSEEHWIRSAMSRSSVLARAITFDRDFVEWQDRLRPFQASDVLLVPAKHSGWGLVVPEGLAAALPVITTRYVESARYYVDDMVNGLIVEPTVDSIYKAIRYCVENPAMLWRLKDNTRSSAGKGDVKVGADKLHSIIDRFL